MCKIIPSFPLVLITFFLLITNGYANKDSVQIHQSEKGEIRVEKMVGGLDNPWAMAMLPDGKLLITEKEGSLWLVEPGADGKRWEVAGMPSVRSKGQGGLLDVVLDPDFEVNNTIYFTFSDYNIFFGIGTAIAKATLKLGGTPRIENLDVLFSMDKKTDSGLHFGSRIVPDLNGNLFFTIGDRGDRPRAQDPFDAAGSVIRIRTDGSVPPDNPFADGKDGLPEIWSIGHRNPQGATLNDKTGELWTLAHGARGGDEINIPMAGKNYGWPVISYGRHYSGEKIGIGTSGPGMEQPVYYWDPSIAPSGFDFYQGSAMPAWNGNLFAGALKYQILVRLEVEDNKITHEERLFSGSYGRIRDVRSFPDGGLWFLTNSGDSSVYRISSAQ